jgi:hypothetical protein
MPPARGGVQQAPRHAVGPGSVERIERRGDSRAQPAAQRQVFRVRVHPVEAAGRLDVVVRQRLVHLCQRPSDECLFSGVLAGERPARYPGQQR